MPATEQLEELTKGMEEVPMEQGLPFPAPVIEEIIHRCILNVQKIPLQNGGGGILQFITPAKIISIRIDEESCKGLSDGLRPSGIAIATPGDLRELRQ